MTVDTLTGRENAAFHADLHPQWTGRWAAYADRLGLTDEDLSRRVGTYSAGMRRKLELALALSVDVPVYLLDEPTAGVDLTVIQRFHDLILEQYERGKTVVVTSHRPMDVDLADRIAFMPDDRVTRVGTPAELVDEVPPVVRVVGTDAMDVATDYVRDGQLFPLGGEARGYLAADTSVEALDAAVGDDARIETVEPTHADLFNYYVHVDP
jgi:ABC-2 type transport system ATP-binding protein